MFFAFKRLSRSQRRLISYHIFRCLSTYFFKLFSFSYSFFSKVLNKKKLKLFAILQNCLNISNNSVLTWTSISELSTGVNTFFNFIFTIILSSLTTSLLNLFFISIGIILLPSLTIFTHLLKIILHFPTKLFPCFARISMTSRNITNTSRPNLIRHLDSTNLFETMINAYLLRTSTAILS